MKALDWALRGLILGLVALLFIPVIKLPRFAGKPTILLLVDASASMASPEKQQEWKRIMHRLDGLNHLVRWKSFSFSDDIQPLSSLVALKFKGTRTDITRAIADVNTKSADAILLISDGRHNGPADLASISSPLPLWTIAVGKGNLADIGIEEAFYDEGDSNQLRIRLRSNGLERRIVKLHLKAADTHVLSKDVELAANQLTEIVLPVPQSLESRICRLELDTFAGEDRTDNNFLTLREPRKKSKIRILFATNRISEETLVILESLKSLDDVIMTSLIEISPGQIGGNSTSSQPDVILLGPIGDELLESTIAALENSATKGIPVLFVATGNELPEGLEYVFPLETGTQNNEAGIRTTAITDILFSSWPEGMREIESRPQPSWRTKPGCVSLLSSHGTTFVAECPKPPHTLALELPAFSQSAKINRDGFALFLRSSLFYLHLGNNFPFQITIEQSNEAALSLELSSVVEIEQEFEAWLSPDSHPLTVLPVSTRSFRVSGTAPRGEYKLNVSFKGERRVLEDKISIIPSESEKPSRGANVDLLRIIAEQNSGELTSIEELSSFVDKLPEERTLDFQPLNTPWVVILAGVLMLAEIWYRRRRGLP